jgi:prevent-host-death family protein
MVQFGMSRRWNASGKGKRSNSTHSFSFRKGSPMWLPFLRALATCFVLIFLYTLLQGDLSMDRYISVSEARQRFLQLVDETLEGDQIIVTKRGTPAIVLIDFERLETLKRIAQLWQNPEAMRAMKEATDDVKAGRVLKMKRMLGVQELLKAAREKGLLRG